MSVCSPDTHKSRRRSNPISMSRFIDHIQEVVNAKTNAHDLKALTKSIAEENSINIPHVDLTIQVSHRSESIIRHSLILYPIQVYRSFWAPEDGRSRNVRTGL